MSDTEAIRVTVFASSTPQTSPAFTAASGEFGKLLATSGGIAVFGGGNAGCMGAFYEAVVAAGGRLHGITHRMFVQPGGSSLSEENAAELESLEIVEGVDLTLRKRRLLDSGDCLVALPGGVGTFDEIFMAIAELGVGCGELPICLLNTDGYYTGIVDQLKRADKEGMLRKRWYEYVTVVDTPEAALAWCSGLRGLDLCLCTSLEPSACAIISTHAPGLLSLDLSGVGSTDDAGLERLARGCPALRHLGLNHCQAVGDDGLRCVAARCADAAYSFASSAASSPTSPSAPPPPPPPPPLLRFSRPAAARRAASFPTAVADGIAP